MHSVAQVFYRLERLFGALGLHRHPGWNLIFLELLQFLLQLNQLLFHTFNANRGQILRIIDRTRALMNLAFIVELKVSEDPECLLCRHLIVNNIFTDDQRTVIRFPVQEGYLLAFESQLTRLLLLFLVTIFV